MYKIPVSNQNSLPTCWLHPTVWSITLNRGYRLLLIRSRIPICRDYNYFSRRLTSLFNPLGKSLRFSTMYSILFYVTGLPSCSVFCPMDNYKKSSSVQGHGHQEFKSLRHACGKWSSSDHFALKQAAFHGVPSFWGLRQPPLKTKQMGCRQNEQMAVVVWELTARFFWELKGRRYLVSVLAYLSKNLRGFLVGGFEHCWF